MEYGKRARELQEEGTQGAAWLSGKAESFGLRQICIWNQTHHLLAVGAAHLFPSLNLSHFIYKKGTINPAS